MDTNTNTPSHSGATTAHTQHFYTADSTNFVKADSRNLPEVNMPMIMEYFQSSDKHYVAEIRGLKALMASRTGYVENAVGFVEVKRQSNNCVVQAKVVPEHKVTKTHYHVSIEINENENTIIDAICNGCAASAGGCKHTIVFLYWLEKRTSEPSSTSVQCYWKKPRLASDSIQPIEAKKICKTKINYQLDPKDPAKLNVFLNECKHRNITDSLITSLSSDFDKGLTKFCIFNLLLDFISANQNHTFENFKQSMYGCLDDNIIKSIEKATIQQADNKLWHSLRQARITASKVYEVCHCATPDGSLVEQILGGYKAYESKAMKRGKVLEKEVMKEVEKIMKCRINECGFFLINLICGASPDGLSEDFIIEIKCPSTGKALKNCKASLTNKSKYYAQCQLQMLATGYTKCAFCVADTQFETNKKVHIEIIDYDSVYTNNLLAKSELFWKNYIYPKILDSAKS